MSATFDPDDTATIGDRMTAALVTQVGIAVLSKGPERIGGGLDTYVYGFRLRGGALPAEWQKPLILRVYSSPDQGEKAEREFAVQRFVAGQGFPAPRPLLVEPDPLPLGMPFMVMERVPGTPLLDRLKNPLVIPRMLTLLADTQARLHSLPSAGWPLEHDGPLVDRLLPRSIDLVERFDLKGPRRAIDWLRANVALVSDETLAVCHTDFHPLNVLLDRRGTVSVVDWTDADVGDRHSDIARTTALFWLAPPLARSWFERTALTLLRGYLVAAYLRRYEAHLPVDHARLRYWQAFHATYAWTQVLALRKAGPEALGAKPEAADALPETLTFALKSYVEERLV